ncbi:MAG: hypothetical protein KAR06_02460, partial [Deltaproteobacteria bacterium]|nr:hypothetical protein [Deltaproteobacteria bacterium]
SGRSQPMYGVARREAKIDSAAELLKKFACRSDCLQFMRCKRGLGSKALIAGDCDVNDFITSTEG